MITQAPHRIQPKLGKNVLGCTLIAVIMVLAVTAACLVVVAKTGVVQVPLFSRLYRGPIPTRLVSAEPMSPEAFRVLLGARFLSQTLAQKLPPYVVNVTEKELTGAVMNAVDAALRDGSWKQVYTQIVVRPTDLEFLSTFERGTVKLDLLARFTPHVQDGGVIFTPVFIQIGDYRLPPAVAYRAASYLFSRDLGTWIIRFGEASLHELRLHDGVIELIATPAP